MTATPRAVELVETAALAAADKLADGIIAYDVSDQLVITDAFLLCSAPNDRQVKAIVDEIELRMRQAGASLVRREGEREGRWVLLDYLDVVIHVQHSEERTYYALERIWKDCPQIPLPELVGNVGRGDDPPRPPRSTRGGRPERAVAAGSAGAVAAWPDGLERRAPLPGAERHPARRDRSGPGRTGRAAARRAAPGPDRLLRPEPGGSDRGPARPPHGPGGHPGQGPAGTVRRRLGRPDRHRDQNPVPGRARQLDPAGR